MWRTIMVLNTDIYPDIAIPPGEYLAEEIEARGLTQKALAERMGRPANAINEIINGKKSITAETALQLEEVMPEIPARFWLNLETDYQLTKALLIKRSKTK
jgi:HTH-type transcriptional regulator / antitoxin HigA